MKPDSQKKILLITLIFTLITIAGCIILFIMKPEMFPLNQASKKQKSATYAVLKEIRDLYNLNTAEYTMKLVFPYDFIEDEIDWWTLKDYYDFDSEGFQEKRKPDYYPDRKLPKTWQYASFYEMCRSAGIEMARKTPPFFIITVRVKAGYDLKPFLPDKTEDEISEDELNSLISIAFDGERKIMTLKKPDPIITEFIIEDINYKEEGYPDVPITPEEWRILITALTPEIQNIVLFKGLLREADKNGQKLLKTIMQGAGYNEILFQ